MTFSDELIPAGWLWAGYVFQVAVLCMAVYRSPWHRLRDNETLHVFLGACVALMVVWSIKTGFNPGLEFHLLCVTTVTLMLGWPLALVTVSVAQAGLTLSGTADWSSYGISSAVDGTVPVLATVAVLYLTERRLPKHFFIYVFVCAFAAGGIGMAAARLLTVGLVLAVSDPTAGRLAMETLNYLPLMVFPEALINGMLITLLLAYRVHWVTTFDDSHYLKNK